MKAVVHSAMSVMDVTFALFTLITELSTVRVSGSSCDALKEFKFFGRSLASSINSPVRISLTSMAGSSWTESIDVSADWAEVLGICDTMASLIAGGRIGPVVSDLSFGEDTWVADAGAGETEPLWKALTAA